MAFPDAPELRIILSYEKSLFINENRKKSFLFQSLNKGLKTGNF